MSKETIVFLGGGLLIITPFLGIPTAWRTYLIVGLGIIFTLIGYALRRGVFLRDIEQEHGERTASSFVETTERLFDENALK